MMKRAFSPATSISRTISRLGLIAHLSTTAPKRKLADGDLKSIHGRFSLANKNFIVTGGGRGIGYSVTRAIAEMGGNVSVLDMSPAPVKDFERLGEEFGVKTKFVRADVTNEESLTRGFEESIEAFGTLDGCVTAAGIVLDGPFVDQSWKEVTKVFDVNITGTFFAAQLAVKQMLKQKTGGSIVLIASVSAHCATPGHKLSAYNTSKGAVKMLGTALSVELGPEGIRVNSISPGYTDTEMLTPLKEKAPHRVQLMNTAPPMKRIGNRNDLTPAVLYLLSEASAYTTGTDIIISGGLHAGRIET